MSSPSSSSCSKPISPRSSLTITPKTAFPSLPTDLIFNILLCLPIISLCKFKTVCKQWFSIITDPFFISTHKKRSLQNPKLLFLQTKRVPRINKYGLGCEIKMLSFGLDGKPTSQFEVCVNDEPLGLYLLPSKWEFVCFVDESGFYLCNPSTHLFLRLPEPTRGISMNLMSGMGYFEERNEYVLIHFFNRSMDFRGDCDFGCEIMRFKDGFRVSDCSWEVVDASCSVQVRGWGVLVKNVFYWMILDMKAHPWIEAILSFDLESKKFGTISPPEGRCYDPAASWFLVELNGSLCLVDKATIRYTMDIWVFKDCLKHEWVKEYSINLTCLDDGIQAITVLDQRDGRILIDTNEESVDWYDLESKSCKRKVNLVKGYWTWLRIYTESFFSLEA